MGLTGFVIIHVLIASFSPAREECNQRVNTKFTRPVNAMPNRNFVVLSRLTSFPVVPIWRAVPEGVDVGEVEHEEREEDRVRGGENDQQAQEGLPPETLGALWSVGSKTNKKLGKLHSVFFKRDKVIFN